MRYPNFLAPDGRIGFCAPSFGEAVEPYRSRCIAAAESFLDLGHPVVQSASVFSNEKAQSNTATIRAAEFLSLYQNPEVDFVLSVGGGERMVEILPYIDFPKLSKLPPKFFMGFSDNTNLTFTLTTLCDIASIYGLCATGFGMKPWDVSLIESYEVMRGTRFNQDSFQAYQAKEEKPGPGEELLPYRFDTPVKWQTLDDSVARMSGRLLGGCLDCLVTLTGTHFDKVKEFNRKYKEDGILWYLESCDLNVFGVLRGLWQLKNAGWFNNASGFIFGRPMVNETLMDVSYKDAVQEILGDMDVPVILDADFGHLPPNMTLINGACATITCSGGRGRIAMELK
ncbi:MAG: LD-carboxypeptidase [Erysipelotrichaceae bacterium]|jgi:muramoyltetrapeptide carboxypeptidase LdcA involved in peptidoglycan recycling|nr:LD-carboxypeptidase [Erysipelotrichaceae bacterium]